MKPIVNISIKPLINTKYFFIFSLIVGLVLTSSCDFNKKDDAIKRCEARLNLKNRLEIDKYINKIVEQKKEIQRIENSLKYRLNSVIDEKDELTIKLNEVLNREGAYIKEGESFQTLEEDFDLSYLKKNKDIFSYAFTEFLLTDESFIGNIFKIQLDNDSSIFEEFRTLWNGIDRSSESIEKLFSDNDKRFVYSLFLHNDYYKTSGMQCVVEGLLLAHQELEGKEETLDSLYIRAFDRDAYDMYDDAYTMVDNLLTEEMKTVLSDENYNNSKSEISNREFYVYSFWARRYHEGNSDIIYKIIKEFHEHVKNN